MKTLKQYNKAIVAFLMVVVASVASALGVEVGIDVGYWWQVLGAAVLTTTGVWLVPNKESINE